MEAFENVSNDGNEKAIRRGKVVPDGDVNLAWAKAPALSPENNIVVIDTSQTIEENVANSSQSRRLYYANSLGILQDINGNALVDDQFPIVSDVFEVDEDWSIQPGSEYTDSDILPFLHKSRFFHLDKAGLTIPGDIFPYDSPYIKVVDDRGRDYVDSSGKKKYKVKISSARYTFAEEDDPEQNIGVYRVYVYVDTDSNENLYLTYSKVEVQEGTGRIKNKHFNHKELLNPIPYFRWIPEESEVVDTDNRLKKQYSTKSASLKNDILGQPIQTKDGYHVYVPKKAIGDPRLFQLFRWRVVCEFQEQEKVDPNTGTGIRCGVLAAWPEGPPELPDAHLWYPVSSAPYAFYNLMISNFNAGGFRFYNPVSDMNGQTYPTEYVDWSAEQLQRYWLVNLNTVTNEELDQFDILILSPWSETFDIGPWMAKIWHFIENAGGTIFIDSNNFTYMNHFGYSVTNPSNTNGDPVTGYGATGWSNLHTMQFKHGHIAFDQNNELGGWNFDDYYNFEDPDGDEYKTLTSNQVCYHGICQFIDAVYAESDLVNTAAGRNVLNKPGPYETSYHWDPIITARVDRYDNDGSMVGEYKPIVNFRATPGGGFAVNSTMGILQACNELITTDVLQSNVWGPIRISKNVGSTIHEDSNYLRYIHNAWTEGAYKFLYNMCLLAISGKILDDSDVQRLPSNNYRVSTPWHSSWVIDGSVLSELEIAENGFKYLPKDYEDPNSEPVWQRQLDDGGQFKSVKQLIEETLTPQMKTFVVGATRKYTIEVTNPSVSTPTKVTDDMVPYAWTNAYSPKFVVPVELGPHIIQEEQVAARWRPGQYTDLVYPPKPYSGRVKLMGAHTFESGTVQQVNYVVHGYATETVRDVSEVPPVWTSGEEKIHWSTYGGKPTQVSPFPTEPGVPQPDSYPGQTVPSVTTWQNWNYYTDAWGPGIQNWPHYGIYDRLSVGSSGELVMFLQEALNQFAFWGFYQGGCSVDGYYGPATRDQVVNFQATMSAKFVDGVADAETWGIIGGQILRLWKIWRDLGITPLPNSGHTQYFWWPLDNIDRANISDGNGWTMYGKRSWLWGGPSVIWDGIQCVFDKPYNIHAVELMPYLEGNTRDMMWRSIHIVNQPHNLVEYASWWGDVIWQPWRPSDAEPYRVDIYPRTGDTVIVGFGQDRGTGHGTSRMIGVRDLAIYADVTNYTPGRTEVKTITKRVEITARGTINVLAKKDIVIRPTPEQGGELSNIHWESVDVDNSGVVGHVNLPSDGMVTFKQYTTNFNLSNFENVGPNLPSPAGYSGPLGVGTWPVKYYWMTEEGVRSPVPETGFVSKVEGVKILCDENKHPFGFPPEPPAMVLPESQMHFSVLSLEQIGCDPSVRMWFWDQNKHEFITTPDGKSQMTWIEWNQRGRNNVYVAVTSSYEETTQKTFEQDTSGPRIPYRWALPVYGVTRRGKGSKIAIDTLPADLGYNDVWPIAVKTGSFSRYVKIRPISQGPLTGWIRSYQGRQVHAFYGIAEADDYGWSAIYGIPNMDVKYEEPLILDDNVLQVRQPPILMVNQPTAIDGPADPVRPAIKVFNRTSQNDPWVQLSLTEISDYNSSTGEIILTDKMNSTDSSLWRVDYTSARRVYNFKQQDGQVINLNPYLKYAKEFIGKAMYIYIVPWYVKDDKENLIEESVQTTTLRMTTSPEVFDPLSANYDPLAIQIGVVYITTALDIGDLTILDTRRRGGGARDSSSVNEIVHLVKEASTYWDISYGSGSSYQKGGFVIVRLPEELKDYFSEAEIIEVIERNITAGVRYKIEDLYGRSWS